MADGMADAVAGDAVVTVGDAVPTPKDAGADADKALGPMLRSALKLCAAGSASSGARFEETVRISVDTDGSATAKIGGESQPKGDEAVFDERSKCYAGAVSEMALPKRAAAWSFEVPVSVVDAPK